MASIKLFSEWTFFMSATEGAILLAMCIVAVILTLAAIALIITVIVTIKRLKREDVAEVSEPVQETVPGEQAE